MIIENLYLYLTWRCNLHCKHCWVSADAENLLNSCEIPDEKYKDIILEACNLGVNFIKISGGEPLLRWNALKIIIQTAVANGCEILLETNGTLLEQKIVDFLKAHNCVISISLDGEQSKHNDLRNSPTAFQQTDKGLKLLISNGIIPQIVYSFSEANDVEIDNMIETENSVVFSKAKSISTVIGQMKRTVSAQAGYSVWQKSFYDRIVRNDKEYSEIWQYINSNPFVWEKDY